MVDSYINKIIDLYSLKENDIAKLKAGRDQIASVLEPYTWNDVDQAIDRFYVRFSDKQRPKISQICAILNDWHREGKVSRIDPASDNDVVVDRPKTNLFTIAETFERMLIILEECGVLMYPDSARPTSSLIDSDGTPVLCPRTWLREQLESAITRTPNVFAPFPHATFFEQLALAFQNKLIRIKVRNWAEYKRNIHKHHTSMNVILDPIG